MEKLLRNTGDIGVKSQKQITFFLFLTAACVPFATVDIAGIGVLLFFTVPLLILVVMPMLKSKLVVSKPGVMLFLFLCYGIMASLWSPSFSTSFLYQYVKVVLLIICIYPNCLAVSNQKALVNGSVVSCLMICVFMLMGSSAIAYVEGRATISVFGASQDPNYIAYAFFFAFTIALDGIFSNKKAIKKFLCVILLAVILYCVLLTGSRGSWISCASIVLIYTLSKYGKSRKTIVLIAILLIALIIIYPFVLQLLPADLARRFTYEHLMHNNGSNRLDIWIKTWNIAVESPIHFLVGYGTGSSVAITGRATHNYFLQLIIEEGLIGLSLFVCFAFSWLRVFVKEKSTLSLCVYVACLVMGLTLSLNTSYYFWVTFLLCILCRGLKGNTGYWDIKSKMGVSFQ